MTRWAFKLEYDGADFHGWQFQTTGPSIQGAFDEALSRLEGTKVTSIVAGRTDAGVHALAQVAHADLIHRIMQPPALVAALNYHLKPHPIAVLQAIPVPDDWNARFSAIGRAYSFRILNRPARAALQARRVWHIPTRLDTEAMQHGANHLLGRHDFTSFRAASCQANSPLRTLDRLTVTREGDIVEIIAEARSFLHHQVRNMVGTLRLVGEARWHPDQIAHALAARNRAAAGPTAPPDGLFLTHVKYPTDPFCPP